jgi:hypothetical protein
MTVATPALVPGIVPVENALAAIRRRLGVDATRGLVPGLLVPRDLGGDGGTGPADQPAGTGWMPASALVTGARLDDLLVAAKQRWGASPHAAAALAWRSYTYWLALPVVLGWATARRVPLVAPEDVLVRVDGSRQLLTLGLRRVRLVVTADDPLADAPPAGAPLVADAPAGAPPADHALLGHPLADEPSAAPGEPGVTVVRSEEQLLGVLRSTLRDHHLDPLLARIQTRVHLGTRTLLGSLASAVAYGVVRGVTAPTAELTATVDTLLSALDLPDLVELEPGPDGLTVHRRTCCLAFTLPEPKICAGCCLRSAGPLPSARDIAAS